MALVVFVFVKQMNKLKKEAPVEDTEKECPYCKTMIPIEATRCPHCTSSLQDTQRQFKSKLYWNNPSGMDGEISSRMIVKLSRDDKAFSQLLMKKE